MIEYDEINPCVSNGFLLHNTNFNNFEAILVQTGAFTEIQSFTFGVIPHSGPRGMRSCW